MMEDPLEMDKIQDTLEDEDHQAHQDLSGPVRPIIVQQPQVTLDTNSSRKIHFEQSASLCYNWLELKIRQTDICNSICNKGNLICKHTQEHYSNWLHRRTNATLTIFLPVYLYIMEATEKVSFHGWNVWKLPASNSRRNIKTEAFRQVSRTCPKCDNGFTKCSFLESY